MNAELIPIRESQLAVFDPFERELRKLEADFGSRVYDMEDPAQLKAAKADRMMISKSITAIEDVRKEAKKEAQAMVETVDARGRELRDRLTTLRDRVWDQVKEFEAREQREQEYVDSMTALCDLPADADTRTLEERYEAARALQIDPARAGKRATDADAARAMAVETLLVRLTASRQRDAERAELERLRKQEAEREEQERIRRQVEEQTRLERERLEKERELAERDAKAKVEEELRKAQEDAKAAEQLAEEAAANERRKIEAEQRAKAEADAAAARAEEDRKAKQEHRARIHSDAREALLMFLIEEGIELDSETATKIITGIKDGKITHVSINY